MARLFIHNHPAKEPPYANTTIGHVNTILWNTTKKHWRKFMERQGKFLDNDIVKQAELYFWGEYEPYSGATIIQPNGCPIAVHRNMKPVRLLPPMPRGALNTDPYVFGCFRNVCCWRGNTIYRKGDVILFGTFISADKFELDTVIVVEQLLDKAVLNSTDQYYLASVKPIINPKHNDFVDGIIYSPDHSMYSFVPCLTSIDLPIPHKPILTLSQLGDGHLAKIGGNMWHYRNQPMTANIWNEIVNQVQKQGWKQGILVDKLYNEQIF